MRINSNLKWIVPYHQGISHLLLPSILYRGCSSIWGKRSLCSSSPTASRDITWTPDSCYYQALSYISECKWCDSWNIWGPIWHSFILGLLISFDRPYLGLLYVWNLWWRKFWAFLGPDWTFGLLIYLINNEGSRGPPTAWPNQATVAFDRPYPGVQYNQKLRWHKS